MGNCQSTNGDWQKRYNDLKFQSDEIILNQKKQNEILTEQREKAIEQGNLLRFKVEVLINMLAIEEKKMETSEKRLEALKWVLLSQGVSQHTVTNLLDGSVDNIKDLRISLERKVADFDMTSALMKMNQDFEDFRKDIIECFADDEGKIVASLSRDEFMRQLYSITEHVSKSDVQLIALRFFDGTSVSVPEFLNFFTTPATIRQAKSAAAAVRMSLDLLALDVDESGLQDPNSTPAPVHMPSTIRTDGLDRGVQKLLAMWVVVGAPLSDSFSGVRDRLNGAQIMLDRDFKAEVAKICGPESEVLKKFVVESRDKAAITALQPLTSDDIDLISERFEIGGRVHFGHFLQFFSELSASKANGSRRGLTPGSVASVRPVVHVGASPFRVSSEWSKLKTSFSLNESLDASKIESADDSSVNVRTRPSSTKLKPTPSSAPFTPAPAAVQTPVTMPSKAPKPVPVATPAPVPAPTPVPVPIPTPVPVPAPAAATPASAIVDPAPEKEEAKPADPKDAPPAGDGGKKADAPEPKSTTQVVVENKSWFSFMCFSAKKPAPAAPPAPPPAAEQKDAAADANTAKDAGEGDGEDNDLLAIQRALEAEEKDNRERFGQPDDDDHEAAVKPAGGGRRTFSSPAKLPTKLPAKVPEPENEGQNLRERIRTAAKKISEVEGEDDSEPFTMMH